MINPDLLNAEMAHNAVIQQEESVYSLIGEMEVREGIKEITTLLTSQLTTTSESLHADMEPSAGSQPMECVLTIMVDLECTIGIKSLTTYSTRARVIIWKTVQGFQIVRLCIMNRIFPSYPKQGNLP